MHPATVPLIYRPRRPWTTALYQCVDRHLETSAAVYEERFAPTYGPWRPIVRTTADAYLQPVPDWNVPVARLDRRKCRYWCVWLRLGRLDSRSSRKGTRRWNANTHLAH